ncbi:MAG: FtsX-like permease family protein [Bacteroidota bacterium]
MVLIVSKARFTLPSVEITFESRNDVSFVSIASETPSSIDGGYTMYVEGMAEGQEININALTIQRDFVKTLGMEIIAGRDLTATDEKLATLDDESRQHSFLVNEELLKRLILSPERAIGLRAEINGRQGEIVGVVKNFHYSGMDRKIDALAMFIEKEQFNKLIVKVNSDDLPSTLSELDDSWKSIVAHRPMIYEFLDEQFNALYRSEQRLGNLFTIFSGLAIFIAAIGLFGLAAFTAQKRKKEIGIRKVLGATVRNIVLMLSKDFTKLVLIAFVLAIPISWFSMNKWLEDFVYKIDIDPVFYVFSGIGVVLLAWLVISYQSFQAATKNPVETLRSE